MSGDFIRCYIGDIALSTLKNVQRESGKFDEWELFQGRDFDRTTDNESQDQFDPEELLLKGLARRCVIAETRQPDIVKPSLIWNNGLNLADVLTMLSIARGRYLSALLVEKHIGSHYSTSKGIISGGLGGTWDIVPLSNLGKFVFEALEFIKESPTWLEESGFTPSIYWFSQAQVSYLIAPSVLEMGLNWVCMETIAGTYIEANKLEITNKKERVKTFISDRGYRGGVWSFLDEVIDDWYKVRNNLFHKGKETLSLGLLSRRRQQIRDFTSLMLVEMLQNQGEERRKEIAKRISSY